MSAWSVCWNLSSSTIILYAERPPNLVMTDWVLALYDARKLTMNHLNVTVGYAAFIADPVDLNCFSLAAAIGLGSMDFASAPSRPATSVTRHIMTRLPERRESSSSTSISSSLNAYSALCHASAPTFAILSKSGAWSSTTRWPWRVSSGVYGGPVRGSTHVRGMTDADLAEAGWKWTSCRCGPPAKKAALAATIRSRSWLSTPSSLRFFSAAL
mmetsp:Transcript_45317/g.119455  ORF Transcript_45317/g.119455 Transcript_45317/m.119455 type:complete len:213 (-) Transcript_45317:340-978(-)